MKKNINVIKFWQGRAFLHSEYEYRIGKKKKILIENDVPLGKEARFIRKMRDHYKCDIIFLDKDFKEEDRIVYAEL